MNIYRNNQNKYKKYKTMRRSVYVLTGKGKVYTLRPSSYNYRQFGFTIEEFEKHCGKNPGDYFAPPVKVLPQ